MDFQGSSALNAIATIEVTARTVELSIQAFKATDMSLDKTEVL